MKTTVSVIVLSYNRPKMLAEALQSIRHADEILVVDDGSDFNAEGVVRLNAPKDCPKVECWVKPKFTREERLTIPRVGKNMNEAVQKASSDVIAYLCDDDLFTPNWLQDVKEYYDSPGEKRHWVRGWWGTFSPPLNPLALEDPLDHIRCNICPMAGHGLTTGSFVHRRECATRCKVVWSETSLAIHDSYLVGSLFRIHQTDDTPIVGMAGWRREHSYNMMKHTRGDDSYTDSAREIIGGMLE